jgi:Family of unknown function (DUF6313)
MLAESIEGQESTSDAPIRPARKTLLTSVRRTWRSQKAHRGFHYWLLFRGVPFAVVVAVIYLVNGLVNGWAAAYDLLVNIDSPFEARMPLLAWLLSFAGWLLVPGLAGAVAGYIVSGFADGRRAEPASEVLNRGKR